MHVLELRIATLAPPPAPTPSAAHMYCDCDPPPINIVTQTLACIFGLATGIVVCSGPLHANGTLDWGGVGVLVAFVLAMATLAGVAMRLANIFRPYWVRP